MSFCLSPLPPGAKLTTMAGSAYYIAPEVLANCYGMEADMWSVGVILYIMLCGVPPFWAEEEEGIFAAIKHGKVDLFSGVWANTSQDAKDLVLRMLTRDPAKRITPEKALSECGVGECMWGECGKIRVIVVQEQGLPCAGDAHRWFSLNR